MSLTTHFRRLFAYEAWANRGALASVIAAKNPDDQPHRLMSHVVAANDIWFARLTGDSTDGIDVFPFMMTDELEAAFEDLAQRWPRYLAEMTDELLEAPVSFTDLRGNPRRATSADILTHLVNHGTYHRAQVALILRRNGDEPTPTDFIRFAWLG
jgi:uncharacterized damage-inducible protein DinB